MISLVLAIAENSCKYLEGSVAISKSSPTQSYVLIRPSYTVLNVFDVYPLFVSALTLAIFFLSIASSLAFIESC